MAYHSRAPKLVEFGRLLVLVVLCIEHGAAAQHRNGESTSSIQQTSDKVKYLVKASGEGPFSINSLLAEVGAKTYEVVGEAEEKCMQIVEIFQAMAQITP